MLKKERQALILKEISLHNKVLLTDLSERFDVSEDTVRRDLQELADAKQLIKVRGGALSKSYQTYAFRGKNIYAYKEKTLIAQKALGLLKDGMLVLIGGGSTNVELARILPPELKVTFLTNSLPTALMLSEQQESEVIFIGGHLSKASKITIGGDVIHLLREIRPDLCFLGVNGIDPSEGVTDSDWEVVRVKKSMLKAAGKVILLTISEKLNSTQKIKICDLADADLLITELDPTDTRLEAYRSHINIL